MRHKYFLKGLERYGADFAAWPPREREAAERLARIDAQAGQAHRTAAALDQLLAGQAVAQDQVPEADARFARRLAAMALPPQEATGLARFLPAPFLAPDFRPAWPRMAALACMLLIGFAVGSLNMVEPRVERAAAPLLFSSLEPGAAAAALTGDDSRLP